MLDTIEVRDHSQPCELGWLQGHWIKKDGVDDEGCPGGKKVVMRMISPWMAEIVDVEATEDE